MGDQVGRIGHGHAWSWARLAHKPRAAATAALAAAVGAAYAPVFADMAREWSRSDYASHGFIVAPLAVYFTWGLRSRVACPPAATPWGLAVFAAGLLLYPLGVISEVQFLPHLSALVALGGLLVYLLGFDALKVLAFPYALLYFMIPSPDTLIEHLSFPLQLLSARFAAMVTGMAGLPIERDGVDIHLASYTFSVGAPCSGMKYVVSLTALAAVMAYLSRGPLWARWLLFAAGLPLALFGNVGRIVCVLAIAAAAGAEAATGFFHGFSGVVVFLLALGGLLLVGRALGLSLAAPAGPEPAAGPPPSTGTQGARGRWRLSAPATYLPPILLLLATAAAVHAGRRAPGPESIAPADLAAIPLRAGDWVGEDAGELDEFILEQLRPEAHLLRDYRGPDGRTIALAVVFGREKQTFHSPGFCLLGGGWNIMGKLTRSVEMGAGLPAVEANEFHLQRGDQRAVVLYFYASGEGTTPSWVTFQYRLLRNRLLGRPACGALVRLVAPAADSEEEAGTAAADLLRQLYPGLREALRAAYVEAPSSPGPSEEKR